MATSQPRNKRYGLASGLALALWLVAAAPATAQVVYKCKAANGVTSYQETPCKRGELIKRIVPDPPPKVVPKPAKEPTAASADSPSPAPTNPPPPPSRSAAPRPTVAYRCTRYDGSRYYSASLNPKRHNVPLYALDQPPPLPPGGTLSPEARVWVEDECEEVPNSEACAHYREQLAFVNAQIRRGAGDANKLERERKRLSAIRGSRCPN